VVVGIVRGSGDYLSQGATVQFFRRKWGGGAPRLHIEAAGVRVYSNHETREGQAIVVAQWPIEGILVRPGDVTQLQQRLGICIGGIREIIEQMGTASEDGPRG